MNFVSLTNRFQTLTPKQRAWPPYLILIIAVFAVYANVYQNPFVWDDLKLIVYNGSLRGGLSDILGKTTTASFYRPIQALLYFFIYQTFGLSQAAYHGVNVLLQVANVCLMYRFGVRLGFYKRASFVAALLWGVHPLWSDSVAFADGIADLLVGFFFMAGLLILLPDFAPRKFWLASLFFVLAIGSKESAVVFPALVTFTIFLVSKKRLSPATYLRTWSLWLLTTAYIIGWLMCPILNNLAAYTVMTDAYVNFYEHNIINRILTSLATLPVYLGLIVWPTSLHMLWFDFPIFKTVWDWHVIAGATIVILALLQIIRGSGKRGLPLTWALLWFAAAFSPYTGILKPSDTLFGESWIYVPTVGLFLGLSQTTVIWVDALHSKKASQLAAGLVALTALALGIKTNLQNEILHSPVSLYENVIKYNPESVQAQFELSKFYMEQGEFDKAIEQLQHVLNFVDKHHTVKWETEIHLRLAMAWFHVRVDKKGGVSLDEVIRALPTARHIPEVIRELGQVLQNNPDFYWAHEALATIYRYQGNNQMAEFHQKQLEAALQKQGGQDAGMLYMNQGEFDKAIKQFQYEIDHPDGRSDILRADIHWKLAMAWLHLRPDKGRNTFTLDVHALPSYEHIPEAIGELEKVLRDNPDYYWAHEVLATLYRYQDNSKMAEFHLKQVDAILQRQGSPNH